MSTFRFLNFIEVCLLNHCLFFPEATAGGAVTPAIVYKPAPTGKPYQTCVWKDGKNMKPSNSSAVVQKTQNCQSYKSTIENGYTIYLCILPEHINTDANLRTSQRFCSAFIAFTETRSKNLTPRGRKLIIVSSSSPSSSYYAGISYLRIYVDKVDQVTAISISFPM